MICLIDSRSGLSIATLVFYICIWIPITQIKQMILDMVTSILSAFHYQPIKGNDQNESLDPSVVHLFDKTAKYRVEDGGEKGCSSDSDDCSICLVEYESEDLVIRLPRCGHVFHNDCIKRWLDRNQFTCPLCRDLLLHVNALPCKDKRIWNS